MLLAGLVYVDGDGLAIAEPQHNIVLADLITNVRAANNMGPPGQLDQLVLCDEHLRQAIGRKVLTHDCSRKRGGRD